MDEWGDSLQILRVIEEDNPALISDTVTHDRVIYIQLCRNRCLEETGEALYLLN